MAKSLPPIYRSIIHDQQVSLSKLARRAGVAPVKKLYETMLADVTAKLKVTASGTFTYQQLQILLAQIKLGIARMNRDVSGVVEDGAMQVGIASARDILQNAARLERHFTGAAMPLRIMETAQLHGLVQDRTSSLMRINETSMARFGVNLVRRMETEMAVSLSTNENHTTAIDRVMKVGDLEWWRAERIVRTEMSYVSNASARDAADEQAVELDGDMWSMWSEHVSPDGTPLDDRVGVDSEAMHGQVAPPGGLFTQPPTARDGAMVQVGLIGQTWSCPPNRPNDRAVLVPWRASWGISGWRWDGQRVPVTEDYANRQNESWMSKRKRAAGFEPAEVTSSPFEAMATRPARRRDETDGDDDEPTVVTPAPAGIGFESPVVMPIRPDYGQVAPPPVSKLIPTQEEATALGERSTVMSPSAIAERGWFEEPGIDLAELERGVREITMGQPSPVVIGVTPDDKLVVKSGRGQLNAAADLDHPVRVQWAPASSVGDGHTERGSPRPGASPVPPGHEPVEVDGMPHYRHLRSGETVAAGGMRIGVNSEIAGSNEAPANPRGGTLVLPKRVVPEYAKAVPIQEDVMDPARAASVVQRPIAPWWYERTTYNGLPAYRDTRQGKGGRLIMQRDIVYPGNPNGSIHVWPEDVGPGWTPPKIAKPQGRIGAFFRRLFGGR
jgi:hypothetical protein